MKKRFELFLYNGCGGGHSEYFDHLEDLMERATEFIDNDVEMASQFDAYDNGKYISHNVAMYIMWEKLTEKTDNNKTDNIMTLEKIKKALSDYNEVVSIVDDFDGSFNDLFERLIGHNLNLEEGTFDVNYKSICASVYTNMGCYYVSGNIEVYDDEKGTATRMFVNEMREQLIQKAEDDECGACIREYERTRNKIHNKCQDYLRIVLKGRTKKMLEFTDSLSVFANDKWCECHSIGLDDCNIVRLELGHGNLCAVYDLDIDSTLKLWSKVRDIVTSAQNQQEQKEVRIKFSASVYIKGKTMREIREKWENCTLLSEDTDDVFHEFDERLLVEDAETYEDLSKEFDDYQDLMYER